MRMVRKKEGRRKKKEGRMMAAFVVLCRMCLKLMFRQRASKREAKGRQREALRQS